MASSRWSFRLNILKSRPPFKGAIGQRFMDVIWQTLQNDFVPALNYVYDAELLTTATGEALDFWGEVYGVPRNDGEDDITYRNRIIASINRDRYVLTIDAIRRRVYDLSGEDPGIVELYGRFYNWKDGITWGERSEGTNIFGRWKDLLKLLAVVSPGLDSDTLDRIKQAVVETVLSPAEVLVVSGDDSTGYNLERRVHDE